MKNVLIINPFGIGDVLFTTPLVRALKENLPESKIGYWCNERVALVFKNNPCINKLFALSRGDLKELSKVSKWQALKKSIFLLGELKNGRFDTCFDFSLDHRYGLVSKIVGIRNRIGFNYKNRGRFLTRKIDIEGYSEKHVVDYYLDLLKLVGLKAHSRQLELVPGELAKKITEDLLKENNINKEDVIIGIAPGAGRSWGKDATLKHWPAENFAGLIDRINDNFKVKLLLLGDISERLIADKILSTAKCKVINLIGKTSLEEFAALVDKVKILITNDGGPLHIASALGKKTLSFFGPVDPKVYGPYPTDENKHIVLRRELECSPCYRNFRLIECSSKKRCLDEITVEQAFAAATKLLPGG